MYIELYYQNNTRALVGAEHGWHFYEALVFKQMNESLSRKNDAEDKN